MAHRRHRALVVGLALTASLPVACAAETRHDAWISHSDTNAYEALAAGATVVFAVCRSERKRDGGPPYEALSIVFSAAGIAALVASAALPVVEVRSHGKFLFRTNVEAIVPDATIPSLWTVKAAAFYRAQIEEMAAADRLSILLCRRLNGADRTYDTIELPDAGRREVLAGAARQCF